MNNILHKNNHGAVIWLTGLSGSGKSTVAQAIKDRLTRYGLRSYVIDGDVLRNGLCSDLGFSPDARAENIRRASEVAKLFLEEGTIVIAALITPLDTDRDIVRKKFKNEELLEVYCACPLEICEARDVKGLYKLARGGLIHAFTGVSAPYEPPRTPDLVVDSAFESVELSVNKIINLLRQRNVIHAPCDLSGTSNKLNRLHTLEKPEGSAVN